MKDKLNKEIGERFRQARNNSGLTQRQCAKLIDGTPQQISNWESGIKAISLKNLIALTPHFNCSIGWIAGENDYRSEVRENVFTAEGDLMAPYIEDGDEVEVDGSITVPHEPGIFAVKPGGKVIFRWLRPDELGHGYTISVTNPANWESERVASKEELQELHIIGKAVSVSKKL